MDYTIIILGVIVIILLYILYKYFSTKATSLTPLANLKNTNVPLKMPTTAGSSNYAYNIWIYVNSWSTNIKPIFSRIHGTAAADSITNAANAAMEQTATEETTTVDSAATVTEAAPATEEKK